LRVKGGRRVRLTASSSHNRMSLHGMLTGIVLPLRTSRDRRGRTMLCPLLQSPMCGHPPRLPCHGYDLACCDCTGLTLDWRRPLCLYCRPPSCKRLNGNAVDIVCVSARGERQPSGCSYSLLLFGNANECAEASCNISVCVQ
jgi:hypothetical protein